MMRVACLQIGYPLGEGKGDRVERVLGLLAGLERSDVVVLPELWPTGYFSFDRYAAEAEGLDGPTVTALGRLPARCRIQLVAGSMVEAFPGGLANTCIVIGPDGSLLHAYRKVHLFGHHSEEARLLTPGDVVEPVRTELGMLAVTTCYDLRFPELYRVMVAKGAQILVVPAAWPMQRLEHWRLLLRARAVENQALVIGCNGAGTQGGVALGGHSAVIDPWGSVLAEAGEDEEILEAAFDMEAVERLRVAFPVLDHRRIACGPLPDGDGALAPVRSPGT